MSETVLLLTATVDPGATINTRRHDPAERLRDYRTALRAWILHGPCRHLVLCESSGCPAEAFADLTALAMQCDRQLEYHSFRQDFPAHLGKGYGEICILAHALARSQLLAAASMVLKGTGRYRVANADRLARQCAIEPAAVVCDLRENLTAADCRWFAATPAFLRDYLLPRQQLCDDSRGSFLEHVLARAVHAAIADGHAWRLPQVLPRVLGIAGTNGRAIRTSWSKRLRHRCKRSVVAY